MHALKAEVERLTYAIEQWKLEEADWCEERKRLAAAEKVAIAAKYAVAMHDDTWSGQEYVAELTDALAEWEALRKEFTND